MLTSVDASPLAPLAEEPRSKLHPAAVSAAAEASVPVMSVRRRIVMVGPFRGILASARSGLARRGTAGACLPAQRLPEPFATEHRLRRTSRIARRPSPPRGGLAPGVRHAPISETHQRLIRLHKVGHRHPVCNLTQVSLLHRLSDPDDITKGRTTIDDVTAAVKVGR